MKHSCFRWHLASMRSARKVNFSPGISNDNREAPEYELPPFSIMQLRNSNDFVPPKYQKFLQLEISYDNRTYSLEQDSPRETARSVQLASASLRSRLGSSPITAMQFFFRKFCSFPNSSTFLCFSIETPRHSTAQRRNSSFFQYGEDCPQRRRVHACRALACGCEQFLHRERSRS